MPKSHSKRASPIVNARIADRLFADNLRMMLASKGLSAAALAQRLGISAQAVSQWLALQTEPSRRRVQQIADVLGVGIERFTQDPKADLGVAVRQLDLALAQATKDGSRLDERTARDSGWRLPAELIESFRTRVGLAMIAVVDDDLHPTLIAGDFVIADVTARVVGKSGIYLLAVNGTPIWRKCKPLLKGLVQVEFDGARQNVDAKELTMLGRAVSRFTRV